MILLDGQSMSLQRSEMSGSSTSSLPWRMPNLPQEGAPKATSPLLTSLTPYMEYALNSEKLKSRLRLIPLKEGFYVLLAGEAPLGNEQLQPWMDAIQAATDRVGRSHQIFSQSHWDGIATSLPAAILPY